MHSEISETQRQVCKRDAENNKHAHLWVTLSLGFLMSFEEAVKSRVSVSVNLVDDLPCCSSPNCKVKAFPFMPKIFHILRDYLKDRTDGETSLEGKCSDAAAGVWRLFSGTTVRCKGSRSKLSSPLLLLRSQATL